MAGAHSSDGSPLDVGTVKNGPDVVAPGGVAFFDDIQIFDAPLTASDVQALRANPGQGLSITAVAASLPMHLLAHWKLEDLSPPYADFSGHSIHLDWDGSTTGPNRVTGVDGSAAQTAWQSPGPGTRLTANSSWLQTDSFGFSFWMKPDFLNQLDNVIAKEMPYNPVITNWSRLAWQVQVGTDDGTGTAPLEFVVRGNNRAQGDFFGNVYSTARLPLYNAVDSWIHVAGGYDSATGALKLFVNGVQDTSSNSVPGAHASDGSPIDIGSVKNGADFVDPAAMIRIDDIQFYDTMPSAYEVASLMANPGEVSTNFLGITNLSVFPSGNVRVTFNSYSGSSYVTEASTDLVTYASVASTVAVNDSATMVATKAALDSAFGTGPRPRLFFRVRATVPDFVVNQCN